MVHPFLYMRSISKISRKIGYCQQSSVQESTKVGNGVAWFRKASQCLVHNYVTIHNQHAECTGNELVTFQVGMLGG